MKVLIIGVGETGFHIASEFATENYDVTVIDQDPVKLLNVKKTLNVAGFVGKGTSLPILEKAGIEEADLFIACTDHDETNLVSCLLANQYSVKIKVAVTRSHSLLKPNILNKYKKNGIDLIINVSKAIAQEILGTANLASATEVASFAENKVLLVGYRVKRDSPLLNLKLKELPREDFQYLLASIVRDSKSLIPGADDEICQGDYIYLVLARKYAQNLNSLLKFKISLSRKAVVAGDNDIAEAVAIGLLRNHFSVSLICGSEWKADQIRKRYPKKKFQIIVGESDMIKLQLQLDVPICSLFISVHNNDHLNLSSCMVAHYMGAQKTIALIGRSDLIQPAEQVGIDVTLSPRLSMARKIKKMIRGTEESVNYTTISETDMEVLEMIASSNSPILGIPLMELTLPKHCLVGAVTHKNQKVIIPSATTKISAGDKLLMITTPENAKELEKLIEGQERPSALEQIQAKETEADEEEEESKNASNKKNQKP